MFSLQMSDELHWTLVIQIYVVIQEMQYDLKIKTINMVLKGSIGDFGKTPIVVHNQVVILRCFVLLFNITSRITVVKKKM